MSGGKSRGSPRASVVMPAEGVPAASAGLPGKNRDGLDGPAVVAQRGQAQSRNACQDDVAAGAVLDSARAAGTYQVERAGDPAGLLAGDIARGEGHVLPATIVSVSAPNRRYRGSRDCRNQLPRVRLCCR